MEIRDPLVAKIFATLKEEEGNTADKARAIRRAFHLLDAYGDSFSGYPMLELLLAASAVPSPQ